MTTWTCCPVCSALIPLHLFPGHVTACRKETT